MTANQIAYYKAREEERHNLAMEQENKRSNVAKERLTEMGQEVERRGQDITAMHYLRSDAENQRSNRATESLKSQEIGYRYAELGEQRRSNLENERLKSITAYSQANLDIAKTDLARAQELESVSQTAYNRAREQLTAAQTATERSQQALTEARTLQTNIETSYIALDKLNNTLNTAGNLVIGGLNYGNQRTANYIKATQAATEVWKEQNRVQRQEQRSPRQK